MESIQLGMSNHLLVDFQHNNHRDQGCKNMNLQKSRFRLSVSSYRIGN